MRVFPAIGVRAAHPGCPVTLGWTRNRSELPFRDEARMFRTRSTICADAPELAFGAGRCTRHGFSVGEGIHRIIWFSDHRFVGRSGGEASGSGGIRNVASPINLTTRSIPGSWWALLR